MSDASTLSTTIIIPNCATLLPGQTGVEYDLNNNLFTLRWTNSTNFYKILRSENQGTAREIVSGDASIFGGENILSWSDTTPLTEGAIYSYTIQFCENELSCSNVETFSFVNSIVDRDGDGLIEIDSLEKLHNIRYNLLGTGYRISTNSIPIARGCPNGVCRGYELTTNLDFDRNDDGSTWSVSGDVYTLDTGDTASYFDITSGWTPIGNAANPFQTVLEGNGYSINNLAVVASSNKLGLFGVLGASADIRGVNISNALIRQNGSVETFMGVLAGESRGIVSSSDVISSRVIAGDANEDNVGGLVGRQEGGNIVASSSKELVVSGARGSTDRVGGLVGRQLGGDIVASSAKVEVKGGGNAWNYVGGLVGEQSNNARIIASYAEGTVDNEGILNGQTGGLVGTVGSIHGSDVKIIASYTNTVVKGGSGASARSGGLVGSFERGSITASYSAGRINASEGGIGKLVGINHAATAGMIIESYGFSSITGTANNSEGEPPTGVTIAQELTAINAGVTWNQANSDTLGAWNFFITPFLRYADYDGTGDEFVCQNTSDASTLSTTIIIPNCAVLLSGQMEAKSSFSNGRFTLRWTNSTNFYKISRSENQGTAREIASGDASIFGGGNILSWSDTTPLIEETTYFYTIQFCESELSCSNVGPFYFINNVVDRDNNGLIEINNLEKLHNIRYNLLGTSYKTSSNSLPNTNGCPNEICNGYELKTNLDFDRDGDGSTWSVSGNTYTLDEGDAISYFETNSGWTPIGNATNPFQTVFKGNGYSINNLAVVSSSNRLGLFGALSALADIRGVNISNALIRQSGSVATFMGVLAGESRGTVSSSDIISSRVIAGGANEDNVGGLVGRQEGGRVIASSAKELVVSGVSGNYDRVGGLVGRQLGGNIVGSFAKAEVKGGGNEWNYVGGLVGEQGNNARIIASYAEGTVDNEGIVNGQTGGLVGTVGAIHGSDVKIIASYANTVVKGGSGTEARSGGLVGSFERSSITASYSAGRINANAGSIGKLVGINHVATAGMIVESYGFSSVTGIASNIEGTPPTSVSTAQGLTVINAGATWNQASSDDLGSLGFFYCTFIKLR